MQLLSLFNTLTSQSARLSLFVFIFTLSACSTVSDRPARPHTTPEITDAPEAKSRDYRERVRHYEKLARKALPADKQYYRLLAMEVLAENGQFKTISERLQGLDKSLLSDEYLPRINLLEAELAYLRNQHPLVLQKLPPYNRDFPPRVQARILRVRALSLNAIGYPVESVLARIQLGSLLLHEKSIEDNNKAIWNSLNALPSATLSSLADSQPAQGLRGWIDLVTRLRNPQGQSRDAIIDRWYQQYPAHPAADSFTERLKFDAELNLQHPNNIALLLPLSGRLSAAAKSVRDGFISGYYNNKADQKPNIRIYDIGDKAQDIWTSLQKAQQEGADIIVGPLSKQGIDEITTAKNLKIPVLGLNYASKENAYASNVFQFGLIPEDEARQAAELAIIRGQMNAALLVPNSSIGHRLKKAFTEHFTRLSGSVLISEMYAPQARDHNRSIQHMLNIAQSNVRNSRLRGTIRKSVKFEPRKRDDIDVIFLVANAAQARAIKPQLKFHYADDIPVYTTSQVYTGKINKRADRDLEDLVYLDTPWTLQGVRDPQFKTLATQWPEGMRNHSRLYALGLDAYRVIPHLAQLRSNPNERFSGHTGNLSVDQYNRIHRELLWATFKKGTPEILEFSTVERDDRYSEFEVLPENP